MTNAETMKVLCTLPEAISDEDSSEILNVLRRRWSPKVFSSRPVEPQNLRTVFEAARWAPSSVNEQPWRFIFTTKERPEDYDALLSCLSERNKQWAQHAPVLILSVAKMFHERDGEPNRHAWHDVGLATANLIVQATALELYVHPMAGFSVQKVREVIGIPEGYEPVAVIALGYLPESWELNKPREEVIPKKRSRKPLHEFVFEGRWGNAAHFIDDHVSQHALKIDDHFLI